MVKTSLPALHKTYIDKTTKIKYHENKRNYRKNLKEKNSG